MVDSGKRFLSSGSSSSHSSFVQARNNKRRALFPPSLSFSNKDTFGPAKESAAKKATENSLHPDDFILAAIDEALDIVVGFRGQGDKSEEEEEKGEEIEKQ